MYNYIYIYLRQMVVKHGKAINIHSKDCPNGEPATRILCRVIHSAKPSCGRWKVPSGIGMMMGTFASFSASKGSSFGSWPKGPPMMLAIWRFPEMGVPLVIIHLNGIFPYKPSICRGTSMTMETPIFQQNGKPLHSKFRRPTVSLYWVVGIFRVEHKGFNSRVNIDNSDFPSTKTRNFWRRHPFLGLGGPSVSSG